MNTSRKLKTGLCFLLFFKAFFCGAQPASEFRGVWIATIDHIDWPSKNNVMADSQKAEFVRLLDYHQRNGINAVVVQIRPSGDAFFPSNFEPWSEWLTGIQGQPPFPYYDPLEFMLTETHKRKMVFHAWINPYRAQFNIFNPNLSPTHITRIHPEWFITYGDKKYFDPGNKEVMNYINLVVRDIVKRYPIDAIHFDDYFYPYKLPGQEFPDEASYRKYGKGLDKASWRRSNTDSIVSMIHQTVKSTNPQCIFGVSPFGVWRGKDRDPQNGSNTHGTLTDYDDLYADVLLWLRKGWIDYVAPQLYWEFGHHRAPFEVLLNWWDAHTYGKQCYIGLGAYKANCNAAWSDGTQLPRQIEALRTKKNIQGMIFFSSKSLENNLNGWADVLRLKYFKDAAALP